MTKIDAKRALSPFAELDKAIGFISPLTTERVSYSREDLARLVQENGSVSILIRDTVNDFDGRIMEYPLEGLSVDSAEDLIRLNGTPGLTVFDVLPLHSSILFLGPPGSGKSTLLIEITAWLCRNLLEVDGPSEKSTPIWLSLAEVSEWLDSHTDAKGCKLFWDFLRDSLTPNLLSGLVDSLIDAADIGNVTFVLDGLDESAKRHVGTIVLAIKDMLSRYPACKIFISSRTEPDEERTLGIATYRLAEFDNARVLDCVNRWIEHLEKQGMDDKSLTSLRSNFLARAVATDAGPFFRNPLLLKVAFSIAPTGVDLPSGRADLYQSAFDLLLHQWEEIKGLSTESPLSILRLEGLSLDSLKAVLTKLAYNCVRDEVDVIPDTVLLREFRSLSRILSWDWAQRLLDSIRERTGILVESEPEKFSFVHRSFVEFLAALQFVEIGSFGHHEKEFILESDSHWQTALFAVEISVKNGQYQEIAALSVELLEANLVSKAHAVIERVGIERVERTAMGRIALAKLRDQACRDMNPENPVDQRVTGAGLLAVVGDSRFNPESMFLPSGPELGFLRMEATSFSMLGAIGHHLVDVPEFYVGKFPVTVKQFRHYLEQTGAKPSNYRALGGPENAPVVWVNWYEAYYYCQFLTDCLSKCAHALGELVRSGWIVRLPCEAEWERAARSL